MEINSSIPVKGMNLDSITSQKGDGIYSLMFNGITESDDHKYTASNEPANIKLVGLPDGYFLIGHVRIRNNRIIVFLVNPVENKSEIGYFDHVEDPTLDKQLSEATTFNEVVGLLSATQGVYYKLVESTESNYSAKVSNGTADDYFGNVSTDQDPVTYPVPGGSIEAGTAITPYVICNCLNFKITSPIYHAVYKPNICDDRIYWTDGLNPPRYLIVDNIEGTEPFVSTKQRVTANVDVTDVTPYIATQAQLRVMPILGTVFFNYMLDVYNNQTATTSAPAHLIGSRHSGIHCLKLERCCSKELMRCRMNSERTLAIL